MEPFITGEDIENRDFLFGRESKIEGLLSLASRHEVAGIVAPRRFGKTCMLKTMYTILRKQNGDAYPVFFSAHGYSIKNDTDKTYCWMATAVAVQMCKDGLIPEGEFSLFRKTSVNISTDEIDTFESFKTLTSERKRGAVFKLAELIRKESGNLNKYLLLLLDEADYLLLTAFESSDDFMRLRTAATQKQAFLKFWVAGPSSWKSMCNSVGSPGLNCGLQNISLLPLNYQDFRLMWNYECSLIENEKIKNKTLGKVEFAFKKSGGVPFYAKYIGRQYQINTELVADPSFMILRDNLEEMFENRFFTEEERNIMISLSKHPVNYGTSNPVGVSLLIEKGIAKKSGAYTELTMEYLADYLRAIEIESPADMPVNTTDNYQIKVEGLVDEIQSLMSSINETYQNKRGKSIFENPESTLKDDRLLRTSCHSKDEYGDYLSVIYLMFYERSKSERPDGTLQPGQRLYELEVGLVSPPNTLKTSSSFYRNRTFFKVIEPLRAAYDAHIPEKMERQPSQYSVADALKYLKGDCNAPETHEWPDLQISILSLFKKELEVIKNEVRQIV